MATRPRPLLRIGGAAGRDGYADREPSMTLDLSNPDPNQRRIAGVPIHYTDNDPLVPLNEHPEREMETFDVMDGPASEEGLPPPIPDAGSAATSRAIRLGLDLPASQTNNVEKENKTERVRLLRDMMDDIEARFDNLYM